MSDENEFCLRKKIGTLYLFFKSFPRSDCPKDIFLCKSLKSRRSLQKYYSAVVFQSIWEYNTFKHPAIVIPLNVLENQADEFGRS